MSGPTVSGVLFLFGLSCFAQTPQLCALSGSVVTSNTNIGIAHVLVSYSGRAMGFRFTDAGGNFRADSVPCGFYSLSVSKPGFFSEQVLSTIKDFAAAIRQGG